MGKKSAHTGISPKDRSAILMDKFISRNANRMKDQPKLPARRKDPNVPLDLWPLKDQIEYWEARTDTDRFDEQYAAYSTWYQEVKSNSGVYPQTFVDFTAKLKPDMIAMWENKLFPKQAIRELRKLGVF